MTHQKTLRFWPLQLTGWLAFGVAMGLSRVTSYPIDYMLATKGTLAVLGLLVSLGLRALYQRLLRTERPLLVVIIMLVTASYVAAFPWTALYNALDAQLLTLLTGRVVRNLNLTEGALYHAFVLVAWSVLYLGVRQYAELQEGRERLLRAQALATEGRLSALRYQLNPHFLYNTLNAISTLVVDQRTSDATRMIARLSDLLRVTLGEPPLDESSNGDSSSGNFSTDNFSHGAFATGSSATGDSSNGNRFTGEQSVAREMRVLGQYLEIEQVRFGDRLTVHFSVSPDAESMLVPTLILQPLVENAIRHGVSMREEGGTVDVCAECAGDLLRITVDDDGPGQDHGPGHHEAVEASRLRYDQEGGVRSLVEESQRSQQASTGIGLRNCRERLQVHYGEQQRLLIGKSPRGGVRVTIELPARNTARATNGAINRAGNPGTNHAQASARAHQS